MRICFGRFAVDMQAERVWKDGVEVRLREQPVRVLTALLRTPGELVSRDALRRQLWGESTYVDFDNGLNTAMSRLREVLEDGSPRPAWIETVPRRGYRFIGSLPRPAAVAAYLKGHHVISPHSPESMRKALGFFEESMALDPSYPMAYHGAALVHILRCLLDDLRPKEALARADEYLQQGLRCPQKAAMVWNTLALLRTLERRWVEADAASLEAIALEPENSYVRMIRAQWLGCMGRHDEAIAEALNAVDLDPVHGRAHMHLTKAYYFARLWEECVRAGRAGLEVCPDPYTGFYASLALLRLGRRAEAAQLNRAGLRPGPMQAVEEAFHAYIAAEAGEPEAAIAARNALKQRRKRRYVPAIAICWLELALGRDDRAMAWLLKASRDSEPYLAWVGVEPMYDRLREHRRFGEVRKLLAPGGLGQV